MSEEKDSVLEENKDDEYEKICYMCHRPESKAGKLIELMNGICICPSCMQKSFDSMSRMDENSYRQLMELSQKFPNVQMINLSDMPTNIPKGRG